MRFFHRFWVVSFLWAALMSFGSGRCIAQKMTDLAYLSGQPKVTQVQVNNQDPIAFKKGNKVMLNPLKWVAKGAMLLYQKSISPQLYSNCAYDMSCSNFAKNSIHEFGLMKGTFMAADRLSRCNKGSTSEIPSVYRMPTGKMIDLPHFYAWSFLR